MSFSEMRWTHVLIALLLTVAVLGGGYLLYRRYWVNGPIETLLMADPDVEEAVVVREEDGLAIRVRMRAVDDLALSYARIESIISSRLGKAAYHLVIEDRRDEKLYEIYHSVHFFIAEAAQRGNFSEMMESVGRVLSGSGIGSYKVTVTDRSIFVQIGSADGQSYLYEIVPRSPQGGTPGGGRGA